MKRKRFVRLLMAKGVSKRMAEQIAFESLMTYGSYKKGWDFWGSKVVICDDKYGTLFSSRGLF